MTDTLSVRLAVKTGLMRSVDTVEQQEATDSRSSSENSVRGMCQRFRLPNQSSCELIAVLTILAGMSAFHWIRYQQTQSMLADCREMGARVYVRTFVPKWAKKFTYRSPVLVNHLRPWLGHVRAIRSATDDRVLERLKYSSELRQVSGCGEAITDEGVQALLTLPRLQSLRLERTSITDAGLRQLGTIDSLTHVTIAGTFTGGGLESFRDQPGLEYLAIGGKNFDGAHLRHLSLMPNLSRLELSGYGRSVSPEAWHALGELKRLKRLRIFHTSISEEGFAEISNLSNLERFEAHYCQLDETTLRHLGGLKSIQSLSIVRGDVTDEGVSLLTELQDLTYLSLRSCEITSSSVDDLNRFPKLKTLYLSDTPLADAPDALARLRSTIKVRK